MGHLLGHRWFENPVYKHMVVPTKRSPKQSDKYIHGRGERGGSNLFPIHLQNPCIKSRSSPETERESSLTPNIAPGTPALNDELADCSGVHPP